MISHWEHPPPPFGTSPREFDLTPLCVAQIALYSLKKAQQRLASAKRKRESPDEDEAAERREAEKQVGSLHIGISTLTWLPGGKLATLLHRPPTNHLTDGALIGPLARCPSKV